MAIYFTATNLKSMKEKKHSANWNIAATHYLTAGFAIPFIVNLVGGIILARIIPTGLILYLALALLNLLGVWLGVKYSAGYLRKTYIITDKNKIVKLTTIYFCVLSGLYFISQAVLQKVTGIDLFLEAIRLAAIGVVLYVASQKYITEDAPIPTEQPVQTEQ